MQRKRIFIQLDVMMLHDANNNIENAISQYLRLDIST